MELSPLEKQAAQALIAEALREDLDGSEDITTNILVPADARGQIQVVARQQGVLSGMAVARLVFDAVDSDVAVETHIADGGRLYQGTVIATLTGSMRSLLTAERTALNFLTMLSGTASLTRRFVEACKGTSARILDTRKTLPGLRALQKYAVRCGGGANHRMGLYDAVLIKDNHLAWWKADSNKSLADAVLQTRECTAHGTIIEIEVDSLDQLRDALLGNPDIVLLDNMTNDQLSEAVAIRDDLAAGVQLEASGGVNLKTVGSIAATGVDRISVGALTHSAVALDIGFDWAQASNR